MLTGTPAHSRPVEPGDVVAVEITGIGRLENTVVELKRDLVPVGEQPRITDQTLHVALAIPEEEARQKVSKYQVGREL
jgi:5-oxopent-3-ene-1,2,5-tricarboxylate decarboxylase / 2-hydroxyhepta-2,4-diene-1,7-dioate isomerase